MLIFVLALGTLRLFPARVPHIVDRVAAVGISPGQILADNQAEAPDRYLALLLLGALAAGAILLTRTRLAPRGVRALSNA